MNKLSKKTVRILNKIKEHILEEPKRLDMGTFGVAYGESAWGDAGTQIPVCKTQGCIAGWAIFLQTPKLWKEMVKRADLEISDLSIEDEVEPQEEGEKILGLTPEQSHNLFYFKDWNVYSMWTGHGWPEKFSKQYNKAVTARGRANATARRIDHFIATNGAE